MANQAIPDTLRRRYIESFPDKSAAIEAAVDDLRKDGSEALQALRLLAHKLAGSAGMYGFEDIGHLAREIVHSIDAGVSPSVLGGLSKGLAARLVDARGELEL